MRSREDLLRLYQQHFGNNHEAGVFAVYAAGVEDGKEAQRIPIPPPIQPPTAPPTVTGIPSPILTQTSPAITAGSQTSTLIGVGKPSPR